MLPLYERIDKLCKDHGTNITQMCKSANVQRSALSDFKSGKNKTISFPNLQKIADYFDMTVDELVNERKPSFKDQVEDAAKRNKKSSDIEMPEDEELTEYLERLKNNPGMRILFSRAKNATKEDLEKVVKIFDFIRGDDYGRSDY